MRKAIVLGASGGMGYALVNELTAKGVEVIAFSRNEEKLHALFTDNPDVIVRSGDILNKHALLEASEGVDTIFHAVNIPYVQWNEKHPVIMLNVLETAKERGAHFVMVDNVYAYGKQNSKRVTEESVKNPETKKGKVRLALEQQVKASGIPYMIVHFPDFYGPNADNTLLNYTLQSVVANKKAGYVGSLQIPREYIFTPDGAKALVELASNEKAYGQNWNIPGERMVSGEELLQIIRQLTGYKEKVKPVSKTMLRFAALFNSQMREMLELSYLYDQPFQLDGCKYEKEIGSLPKTPYVEGLKRTLEHLTK